MPALATPRLGDQLCGFALAGQAGAIPVLLSVDPIPEPPGFSSAPQETKLAPFRGGTCALARYVLSG